MSRAFGGVRAVQDLSFSVEHDEILGLVGPNGSGKTTVFNLIAGTLRPDAGEIYLAGRRITADPPSLRSALGIARTFQLVRVLGGLTALENVLVAALYGRRRAPTLPAARGQAARLLEVVGLAAKAGAPSGALTLAERRRLEIARALATAPRLLLLDEPIGGLNPAEGDAMLALFQRIRGDGVAVILVEHNVRAVRAVCDRVLVLNSGHKIAEGRADEALAQPQVAEVYLGTHASAR
ncbi:MAG: ABC transporter ATP-binding protein [Armatimonadota bacterium]|nr:ABC transporter ATP-binding protein [Armatimonadota bacterium]MDR7520238.1 ABC transporter ATP-binding protein [Armatimonadota bacterium]